MTNIGVMLQGPLVLALLAGAAIVSAGLSHLLHPLFRRYALARPNARSSHKEPTPQGGGIAVIAAVVLAMAASAIVVFGFATNTVVVVLAATVVLAIIGAIDDARPLNPFLRLAVQSGVVFMVLYALPADMHILPVLPVWLERAALFVGLLWFINLVNFMDGIDWMTVAEVAPVTAALAVFGLLGALPSDATCMALALCGAMLGFAPFNRPVARLFLGDVGSLPIGLLMGWLLILLADKHLAAALLLPLYYLADATITLLRRLRDGEPVWQAHRRHFYQRALDGGLGIYKIVGRVFVVNVALAGLGALTILQAALVLQVVALAVGAVLVGALLLSFSRINRADTFHYE